MSRYFKDLLSRTFITKEESINYDNPDEAIAIINKYFEERIGERALFFCKYYIYMYIFKKLIYEYLSSLLNILKLYFSTCRFQASTI